MVHKSEAVKFLYEAAHVRPPVAHHCHIVVSNIEVDISFRTPKESCDNTAQNEKHTLK